MKKRFLRYDDGLWPNLFALAYALLGYTGGFAILLFAPWWASLPGVLLLGHSMVIAAYLIHECAHNTLFGNNRHNERLGRGLNWITGGCYGDYEALRHKHFRHHVDKADVVAFDYRRGLRRHPLLLRTMQVLEWAYIPALDIMMHSLQIVLPFVRGAYRLNRRRVLSVLLVRGALFTALAWTSPSAALLYVLAYFFLLHVLRFMDAFQHSYEVFETLEHERGVEARLFDRQYEHDNTYSNLFSRRHPWLNLLVLNFGYHNAHHLRQALPWYRLPALHKAAWGDDDSQLIPLRNQLWSYHQHRVSRLLNDADERPASGPDKGMDFVGVDGVNFLTAF
jgi:omega-6 fatty acid desaturase (delta-12 desaturase)